MSRLVAIFICGLVFVIACGGNGDDDDSPGAPDATGPASTGDTSAPTSERSTTEAGDSSEGDSAEVELCQILTREEVEAAVGNVVEEVRQDLPNSCIWDSDPNETNADVLLVVGPTVELCAAAFANDPLYPAAPEFGENAFYSYNPASGGLAGFVVCTDRGQFSLTVYGGVDDTPDEARLREAAEELMRIALERL